VERDVVSLQPMTKSRDSENAKTYKCVAINPSLGKRHAFYGSTLAGVREMAKVHVASNYTKTAGWEYELREVFKREEYDTTY
jgi:hypothetical protein